ncbi:lipoyl synthase [Candidatus Ichthyocystis hellenicum]|uniref:lipoyl synthase n=1 Tax=Candidatus Ichthyocystis hellenicum TaxID=1561003 RepID=UPI000AC1F8E0|nr:lipoyl synthase [Candidatus Ichthyocystis hellenicum]
MAADRTDPMQKQKGQLKTARIPIKVVPVEGKVFQPKPKWLRVKAPGVDSRFYEIKKLLREHNLHTVCEEASCPNIGECFGKGTATFMIMGDKCTRRCPFCDVGHGRPDPLDNDEPQKIAQAVSHLNLSYVVITSVDRDDLRDGGAAHFAEVVRHIRRSSSARIELLVPDFRGRLDKAVSVLSESMPDVMNHNLETVPRLYKKVRPGADYQHSLSLLKRFAEVHPDVPTKSGLMLGCGETDEEIHQVMKDLRFHGVKMLTLGQYLQPSQYHLSVDRYVSPDEFSEMEKVAYSLGFTHAACGPLVRSSYHADVQAIHAGVCS